MHEKYTNNSTVSLTYILGVMKSSRIGGLHQLACQHQDLLALQTRGPLDQGIQELELVLLPGYHQVALVPERKWKLGGFCQG